MYKCARGASCAHHQLPRPAASHQMRGLIDFCTTPVTRQSHSILRGRTIKGRRSTKSCTGRLTQNASRCKLIKIASTNVIIVSVCCVCVCVFLLLHGYYVSEKPFVATFAREELQFSNRQSRRSEIPPRSSSFLTIGFQRGSFGKSNSPSLLRREASFFPFQYRPRAAH